MRKDAIGIEFEVYSFLEFCYRFREYGSRGFTGEEIEFYLDNGFFIANLHGDITIDYHYTSLWHSLPCTKDSVKRYFIGLDEDSIADYKICKTMDDFIIYTQNKNIDMLDFCFKWRLI
jgi:hypothetical protein